MFAGASATSANSSTSLGIPTVWRCIAILSGQTAGLDLQVWREGSGARKVQKSHPAWRLMRKMANPFTTAYDLRRAAVAGAYFFGNSYIWIERDRVTMAPKNLYLAQLQQLMADTENGAVWYDLNIMMPTGHSMRRVKASSDDVIHLKANTLDGVTGLQLIRLMSNTLGAAIAAEEFANKYYTSGASLAGVVEYPKTLGDQGRKRLQEYVDSFLTQGESDVLILEDEAKYKEVGGDMTRAANKDAREFSVADICRIFGVPQSMVGDTQNTTYNNSEQFALQFITHTLRPICEHLEAEFDAKLLTVAEYMSDEVYFEHGFEAMLRGDTAARMRHIETGVKWGILKLNEARQELGYEPDPDRDIYITPVNMQASDQPQNDQPA